MNKEFQFKDWFLEITNSEVSFNITLHKKEKMILYIRRGKLGVKYFFIETFDKRLINF